jgi:hypothetical protein
VKGYRNSPIVRRLLSKRELTVFLCLLVGVGLLWWLLVPKEPSYQGKTLTEWQKLLWADLEKDHWKGGLKPLDEVIVMHYERKQQETVKNYQEPFRSMAPKSIPILLKQIQITDSNGEIWLRGACRSFGLELMDLWHYEYQKLYAKHTLIAMEDAALPAVPDLVRLAESDPALRQTVIEILSRIGANSPEVIALLVREAEHFSLISEIDRAAYRLGGKAAAMLPELERMKAAAVKSGDQFEIRRMDRLIQIITTDQQYPEPPAK